MNCGPCKGVSAGLKALSHSDSYTWAMENRSPSRSFHREGSLSSLGSPDLSFSDIYLNNCSPTESQVRKISIINEKSFRRRLGMGINLCLKHSPSPPKIIYIYFKMPLVTFETIAQLTPCHLWFSFISHIAFMFFSTALPLESPAPCRWGETCPPLLMR